MLYLMLSVTCRNFSVASGYLLALDTSLTQAFGLIFVHVVC